MNLGNICICSMLLSIVQVVNAAELQRLFTTPEERLQLNQTRERPPKQVEETAVETTEKVEEVVQEKIPETIVFNGLLKRSQGPTTVWINGSNQPVQEGFFAKTEAVVGAELAIVIGKDEKEVHLKPGQTIYTTEGQIKESFVGVIKVDKSVKLD